MSLLDQSYELSASHIEQYERDGFIRLKDVLSAEILEAYGAEIRRVVRDLAPSQFIPAHHRDLLAPQWQKIVDQMGDDLGSSPDETYARAFTQRFNLWNLSVQVKQLTFSKRLAKIATELMQVQGVRLYHDQALFKEAGGGHTPWHCDQFYWPLSSDKTITAWIPLQAVDADMGPLGFARGSHLVTDQHARSMAISDDSETAIAALLKDYEVISQPFDVGEVSFHAGWTFHRAPANCSARQRAAFTMIYMDKDIRVTQPEHPNQHFDTNLWIPGIAPGQVAASPLNPVLYEH